MADKTVPAEGKRKGLLGGGALKPHREKKKPKGGVVEEAPPVEKIPIPDQIPLAPGLRLVEVYPVNEPHAFIRVSANDAAHETVYEVLEPPLDERERKIFDFIRETMVDMITVGYTRFDEKSATAYLKKNVEEIMYDYSISLTEDSKDKVLYYIIRDFLGFGKMDALMKDPGIEDISCDGPGVTFFIYHRKYESIRTTVIYESEDELDSFVIQLAQRSGKHISIADPLLDATLPDGSRLNATLSDEVTAGGSTFTIRKFRDTPFTPADLVRFKTMSPEILAYWWLAVQYGSSAIYSGGTASGKTTSLNAILLFIPPQMKIVTIEDTRELNLPHPNWIAGTTRSGFGPRDDKGRQIGEIDMFTLLKAALRQRPEYILVGEVRGQEAYALFQAMATGHTAYGTMHADSVESAIHRLESEPINVPRSLLEALDIVSVQIQTRIGGKRVRRSKEITEIVGLDPHTREILTNSVFTWNPTKDEFEYSGVSYVLERIQLEKNITTEEMREELARRKEIILWMVARGLKDYKEVAYVVQSYYRDPEKTMKLVREDAELAAFKPPVIVPVQPATTPAPTDGGAAPAPAATPPAPIKPAEEVAPATPAAPKKGG